MSAGLRLIFDGMNLAHRCRHAHSGLTTTSGKPTGVLFGVLQTILNSLKQHAAATVVIAWDEGRSWRYTAFPAYKGERQQRYAVMSEEDRADLDAFHSIQLPETKLALHHLGLPQLFVSGLEADDIIAWTVQTLPHWQNVVVSTDKDYVQLARYMRTRILNPITDALYYQSASGALHVNTEAAPIAPSPRHYLLWRVVAGDKSDSIPGVRGVGETTAAKLLSKPNANTTTARAFVLDHDLQNGARADSIRLALEDGTLDRNELLMNLALSNLRPYIPHSAQTTLLTQILMRDYDPIFLRREAAREGSAFLQFFRSRGFGFAMNPSEWSDVLRQFRALYQRTIRRTHI